MSASLKRGGALILLITLTFPFAIGRAQSQPDPRLFSSQSDSPHGAIPVVVDVREDPQSGNMLIKFNGKVLNTQNWIEVEETAQKIYPNRIVKFRFQNGEMHTMPRTMLGVILEPIEGVAASQLRIKPGEAVVVDSVVEGLPAAEAGLRQYDIILSCNGQEPVTKSKFTEILTSSAAGDQLSLVLLREGVEVELPVRLERYDPALVRRAGGQDLSRVTYRMVDPEGGGSEGATSPGDPWSGPGLDAREIDQLIARLAEDDQLMQFEVLPPGFADLQQRMMMMRAPTNNVSQELQEIRLRLERMEKALEMLLQSQFGNEPTNRGPSPNHE